MFDFLNNKKTVIPGQEMFESIPLRIHYKCGHTNSNLKKTRSISRCQDLTKSFAEIVSNKQMKQKQGLYPQFEFTKEEVLQLQLEALSNNDEPYADHGIEVLYRFASFDPWSRCRYFGKNQDMGQFERFRRMFHVPAYSPLLNHTLNAMQDALQVSETSWMQNVQITSTSGKVQVYSFFMVQHIGGSGTSHLPMNEKKKKIGKATL
eukprot:TRINITY_DN7144_c0_g1_i6.p1 TRINITY_DN7144_c0_g1~~TRINITY_DN7144_c0_g1_i6.p1  ORF type:complete len:206 (-),score=11.74 TRINITY_DN7144_c0_g1_i6:53-670(-)